MGLEGTWTNELGSTLVIESVTDGSFSGSYTTAVSTQSCAQGNFPVAGQTDTDSGGSSVAWTVVWKNDSSWCQSVTAWAGQLDPGGESISAFWLLSSAPASEMWWASTNIGVDYFWSDGAEKRSVKTERPLGSSHP